jgi:hypothetical protein
MYQLMRRKDNLSMGSMLSEDDDEEDGVQAFLEQHDLYKKYIDLMTASPPH